MTSRNAMNDSNKFEVAIDVVLKHEGGLADVPQDPGGITHWGISLRSYPELGRDGIKNLSKDQAKEIYRKDWWDRYSYGAIESIAVATKVFDLSVNMGPGNGHRILQRAVNFSGELEPLVVDGAIGPKTIAAVNASDPWRLQELMCFKAAEYYHALARRREASRVFLLGWLNRAFYRMDVEKTESAKTPIEIQEPASYEEAIVEVLVPGGFDDVSESHWAHDAITDVASSGLMAGDSGKFRPGDFVTRAEMAVILQRLTDRRTAWN